MSPLRSTVVEHHVANCPKGCGCEFSPCCQACRFPDCMSGQSRFKKARAVKIADLLEKGLDVVTVASMMKTTPDYVKSFPFNRIQAGLI